MEPRNDPIASGRGRGSDALCPLPTPQAWAQALVFWRFGSAGPEEPFLGILDQSCGAERAPLVLEFSRVSGFPRCPALAGASGGCGECAFNLEPGCDSRRARQPFARGLVTLRFSTLLPSPASRLLGLFPGRTQSSPRRPLGLRRELPGRCPSPGGGNSGLATPSLGIVSGASEKLTKGRLETQKREVAPEKDPGP